LKLLESSWTTVVCRQQRTLTKDSIYSSANFYYFPVSDMVVLCLRHVHSEHWWFGGQEDNWRHGHWFTYLLCTSCAPPIITTSVSITSIETSLRYWQSDKQDRRHRSAYVLYACWVSLQWLSCWAYRTHECTSTWKCGTSSQNAQSWSASCRSGPHPTTCFRPRNLLPSPLSSHLR